MTVELLKVSAWSNPKSVAGAIAGVLRERGWVDVQVIGAAALNQAVKAIAISRSYVASEGLDPICIPGFTTIDINGESRTAIRLHVEDRSGKEPSGVGRSKSATAAAGGGQAGSGDALSARTNPESSPL